MKAAMTSFFGLLGSTSDPCSSSRLARTIGSQVLRIDKRLESPSTKTKTNTFMNERIERCCHHAQMPSCRALRHNYGDSSGTIHRWAHGPEQITAVLILYRRVRTAGLSSG